jgi:hypothetical protein
LFVGRWIFDINASNGRGWKVRCHLSCPAPVPLPTSRILVGLRNGAA